MLEEIPNQENRRRVFRLANHPNSDLINELGLDTQAVNEIRELLERGRSRQILDEFCDGPFRKKHRFRERSRFSDGSFPVFYSALDVPTAQAEKRHSFLRFIGQPQKSRTAYYQRFSCTFEGVEKDIRARASKWPELVNPTDYNFCNRLGAEAHHLQIDALVTPSARCEGSNLPVFSRNAIRDPALEDIAIMTYHPGSGDVTIR